jgi:hypothetical protein
MGKRRSLLSLENSMFHLPRMRITRPYRTSVGLEEERLWVGFYRRVANPAIAAEVIQHLDGDADQKRIHPGIYLRCKESLRKKKARQARMKRIRSFMRRILGGLLHHSEGNPRPQLRHSACIVVEGLSESMREPAQHAVKSRSQTAELAAAQPDGGQPNAVRPSASRLDSQCNSARQRQGSVSASAGKSRSSVSSDTAMPTSQETNPMAPVFMRWPSLG